MTEPNDAMKKLNQNMKAFDDNNKEITKLQQSIDLRLQRIEEMVESWKNRKTLEGVIYSDALLNIVKHLDDLIKHFEPISEAFISSADLPVSKDTPEDENNQVRGLSLNCTKEEKFEIPKFTPPKKEPYKLPLADRIVIGLMTFIVIEFAILTALVVYKFPFSLN